eukprot:2827044-Prorocentrum_lima.AAC.1
MTSSLVGSEMCIRDSHLHCRRGQWAVDGARVQPHRRLKAHVCNRDTAAPVSYTHLTLPTICSV